MTNRIWQNFLASNIHRGINKVAAQKSSSSHFIKFELGQLTLCQIIKYELGELTLCQI